MYTFSAAPSQVEGKMEHGQRPLVHKCLQLPGVDVIHALVLPGPGSEHDHRMLCLPGQAEGRFLHERACRDDYSKAREVAGVRTLNTLTSPVPWFLLSVSRTLQA